MPHCLVKDPVGKYAVWSSVVDNFLLLDATADETIAYEMDNPVGFGAYIGGREGYRRDWEKQLVNIEEKGKAWEWAPTWERAIGLIVDLHGPDEYSLGIIAALPGDRLAGTGAEGWVWIDGLVVRGGEW